MISLGETVTLDAFTAAMRAPVQLNLLPAVRARLVQDRALVDRAVAGPDPVYGLNTGLGANLGHRLAPDEIAGFQRQLIEGRAVAVGAPLPEEIGRGLILSRLVSASGGGSGISLAMFDYLMAVYASGLSPVVPKFGSIGAGDLTQNASAMLALLGSGRIWHSGRIIDASVALASAGLVAPDLHPKDAMALINHGGVSVALAAAALSETQAALFMARAAILLSYAGYDANRAILAAEVNALRPAPGQAAFAVWLASRLEGGAHTPRRVQEALSFRVVAPVHGAAEANCAQAAAIWEQEANGLADSPAVLDGDVMRSTPNFHAPALALALEACALANAMVAAGAVQRCQRMMSAELSGLARYLTPVGGASAGMVPSQKTAASLLGEIRRLAMPVVLDPAPVSETVEDMAPMTPLAALKLSEQSGVMALLVSLEALTAAQAIDLRAGSMPEAVRRLHSAIRREVPMLNADRPLGIEVERVEPVLRQMARVI